MTSRWIVGLIAGALALLPVGAGWTAEHGGKEHGGHEHGSQEHGGQAATAEPSAEAVRQAIRDHIATAAQDTGAFTIQDPVMGKTRTLSLVNVHERVGKTGQYYYSCTDMKDATSGETLDLDFDVDAAGGRPKVVDVRIHKVNGQARYSYDDKDNRIPVSS